MVKTGAGACEMLGRLQAGNNHLQASMFRGLRPKRACHVGIMEGDSANSVLS